jgi:hypothetical protein
MLLLETAFCVFIVFNKGFRNSFLFYIYVIYLRHIFFAFYQTKFKQINKALIGKFFNSKSRQNGDTPTAEYSATASLRIGPECSLSWSVPHHNPKKAIIFCFKK